MAAAGGTRVHEQVLPQGEVGGHALLAALAGDEADPCRRRLGRIDRVEHGTRQPHAAGTSALLAIERAADGVPGARDLLVHCGSLSKVLSPGLRVGWMVAPAELLAKATMCKQFSDAHTSTFAQATAAQYLKAGRMPATLARVRKVYAERAQAMTTALRRELGGAIDFVDPQGGLFVWAQLTGAGGKLADGAAFLFASRPLVLDEKAAALLSGPARGVLGGVLETLRSIDAEWTAAALEAAVRSHAERQELKLGAVAQPLRAALTGRSTSPGVFDVLAVLGRGESLARISDQID